MVISTLDGTSVSWLSENRQITQVWSTSSVAWKCSAETACAKHIAATKTNTTRGAA